MKPETITAEFTLEAVSVWSPYLNGVIDLWGRNRATLGLFPRGAFEAYASKGGIYVAITRDAKVAGYFAFRVSRGWVRLVHLCVADEHRGSGVADLLVARLRQLSQEGGLEGITLKCRHDFERARKTWSRLKFVPLADVPGRSFDGSVLTVWVISNHVPDLFSASPSVSDKRIRVAIDANVLFDLFDEWGGRNEEALVLKEPWMTDAVELCVADVIHIEIDGCSRADQRQHYHARAQNLRGLVCDEATVTRLYEVVQGVMGWGTPDLQQHRDMLHLAKASAGGAAVFLTRDDALLNKGDELEPILGLRLIRPAELVSWLDEAERSEVYEPARLAGTDLIFRQVRADEIDDWGGAFQSGGGGETLERFRARVRAAVAKVRGGTNVRAAKMSEVGWLSLVVEHVAEDAVLIEMLRLARTRWAPTLARHHLLQAVLAASQAGKRVVRVTDPHLGGETVEALRELHFTLCGDHWVRPLVAFVGTWLEARPRLVESLTRAFAANGDLAGSLPIGEDGQLEKGTAAALEARFWPLKLLGADLPTYLVPIQGVWAAPLFDAVLASRSLFGAPAALALNRENVYYRSAKPGGVTAPGRILWYVSGEDDQGGTMAVRACSRLTGVEVGSAKELFRRYHRLGIYEWKDVVAITGGDPAGTIMALRFSDTEMLRQPSALADLARFEIRAAPMSPRKLNDSQFAGIYRIGEQGKEP